MKVLTAQKSILFESKLYDPGDELPTKNADMTEAWLAAGTAVWIDDETVSTKAKARPRTAEPGQPGAAVASESEDGDNLAGKVPKTASRRRKSKEAIA